MSGIDEAHRGGMGEFTQKASLPSEAFGKPWIIGDRFERDEGAGLEIIRPVNGAHSAMRGERLDAKAPSYDRSRFQVGPSLLRTCTQPALERSVLPACRVTVNMQC